jgi:O-antigen/teichoic acid export membrane protein
VVQGDQVSQSWVAYLPRFVRAKLAGRQDLQDIVSNTGWLMSDKLLRMAVGFLVGVWIARYLGPAQFGLLNYAVAFVAMFSALATLGLEGIVVRDLVHHPARKEDILGTAFLLKAAGGLLTLSVTILAILLLRPDDRLTHWLVGITAIGTIFQAFDTIDFWFQSKVRSKYTVYAKNCAYLVISGVKVVLIIAGAPLVAFAWAGLAETVIGSAGLVVAFRVNGQSPLSWSVDFSLAKKLLKDSWPLIFSGTFVLVNMLIDKIMLGSLSSNAEVGLYSAATRLSELWYFIPMVIGASVMPSLVKERAENELSYQAKLQQTYNLMSGCSLALALPLTFLAPALIALLYGSGYAASASMLSIHIWTGLFVFHVSIRTRSLMIEGLQTFIAVLSFFTMLFNIILNYALIPAYGGIGASSASLLSWMLCALVVPFLSRRTSGSVRMFLKSLYCWIPIRR